MGCRSDYMEANQGEKNLSEVLTFLEELETGVFVKKNADGYRKDVYNVGDSNERLKTKVPELCSKLQTYSPDEVKNFSLELQMWWRDHQEADRLRIEKELKDVNNNEVREQALSKLTDYERNLLGL